MNLILTKPKKGTYQFSSLIAVWLKDFCGIYIGEIQRDWTMEYNSVYGFYDLILWPTNGGKFTDHFAKVEEYFRSEGYKVSVEAKWPRWIGGKQQFGVRIWIYAKDGRRARQHTGVHGNLHPLPSHALTTQGEITR